MCSFFALVEILPYLCLVTVPIIGSFFGGDVVIRLAVYLAVHAVIVECIPKKLVHVLPILNVLLFALLMYLPMSLTPWPLVWLLDKIIWTTNPVFMIAEVILLQNFVMRRSQTAADKIEEDPDDAFSQKALILLFSSLCYAVAASLAYDIFTTATGIQVICLFVVICIIIAIHNMMLMAHEGIISDCAYCSLISIGVLYVMITEAQQISTPLAQPLIWKNSSYSKSSVYDIVLWILNLRSGNAQKSIKFLQRFVTPFFICLLAVRLYSILYIAMKVTRNFLTEKSDDESNMDTVIEEFDEEDKTPWRSPLLMKLCIIFMLTQFTVHFLEEWTGTSWKATFGMSNKSIWPSQVLFSRLLQIFCVNAFYIWRLYRADDWIWHPWFTP